MTGRRHIICKYGGTIWISDYSEYQNIWISEYQNIRLSEYQIILHVISAVFKVSKNSRNNICLVPVDS